MKYFKIIIPNYNNEEWIEKCVNSILSQTFDNYMIIIIDDVSTDNSRNKILELDRNNPDKICYMFLEDKKFNGGSRNIGIETTFFKSEYTMFIDGDDWFVDNNCLQDIYNLIQQNNMPDCIRLSYNLIKGNESTPIILDETKPEQLVKNCNVACWLKVVKSELVPLFQENTLMEDVVFSIAQCDKINTIVPIKRPIINWNRNNIHSCSIDTTQQNNKWASSQYRYVADLMDLKCTNEYCEIERITRLNACLNYIKNGIITQNK